MEKKSKKVIVYTICFACIMLIDWTRGSQPWHVWATCINLTGAVLSVIMLSHFSLKKVPFSRYLIWLLIWLTGSGVGYLIWRADPGEVFLPQYIAAAVSVGCMGIVALQLWQERKTLRSAKQGNRFLAALWVILSVLMLVSRFSELWPLWYLILFGMFYIVPFTQEEKRGLWDGLANGVIIFFFLIQIFAYGFRPYDEVRYKGAYGNCNINSMMYLMTFIMILYKIHCLCWKQNGEKKTWKKRLGLIFFFVLAAGMFSFLLFTMTRTAILVAAGILIVYGILEAFVLHKVKWWKIVARGAAFCLCVVLTIPCVYLTIRYLPTILHHPVWWEGEYSVNKVHSYDPSNSEKYVTWDEAMELMLGRMYLGSTEVSLEEEDQESAYNSILLASNDTSLGEGTLTLLASDMTNREANDITNNETNDITSSVANDTAYAEKLLTDAEKILLTEEEANSSMRVRLEIYKRYWNHLNWNGHILEEGYFPITEDYHAWHAQNVFLQIAFYHGIPAGICFILLMIGLGVWAVKLAIKGGRKENILPLLIGMFFIGYGMMECVWYLGQGVLFFLYLIPRIMIDDRTNKVNE